MAKNEREPAASLGWDQILSHRLKRQNLAVRRERADSLDVISEACGLQAQVMSSAELALWARVDDLDPDDVQGALWRDRTLVKTWAMRSTLHLLPASELALWVAAQGVQKPRYQSAAWEKYFGIKREEMDATLDAIASALGEEPLTRERLADAVAGLIGSNRLTEKMRESWGAVLKPAAHRGELLFGPNAGRNVTFVHPDVWLGEREPLETDAAIREVIRRYLSVYGPATRDEFARWFGMTSAAQAGKRMASLEDEVEVVEVEGTRAWMLAKDIPDAMAAEPGGIVRLLPAFDHYVIAAPRDSEHVLPASLKKRVYRPQGWLSPVLLVDGRMEGVWRHERKGEVLNIQVEPFRKQPKKVRDAVEDEAERLARFLGGEPQVIWEKP